MRGDLRAADADKEVVLMGWVHRRRDLGNLIFIDLRDRAGLAQIVFNKELAAAAHARAEELRSEFVVAVRGRVARRQKPNPELASGEVEVIRLGAAHSEHGEDAAVRGGRRSERERRDAPALPLSRSAALAVRSSNIALRHRVILEIRKTLDELGFYEIETPMLTRSTPEGARDYLVPSRVHHGQFYALPQSPQIFKQILMIGGLDRYFQIVRCFRDEDLRADRQPEFTQLDLEMSFPTQETIFGVIEQVMVRACAVAGIAVKAPFRHMEYREAIRRYGIDKPDLRFGMELHDVTRAFRGGARETAFRRQRAGAGRAGRGVVFAQAARRIGRAGQGAGRARAVHGESDRGGRRVRRWKKRWARRRVQNNRRERWSQSRAT